MADDRVRRETAELVNLPPHTWYVREVGWLLKQEKLKNVKDIPLNQPLLESLKRDGPKAPFLTMQNWYPIAGSQRCRALLELPELHSHEIRICRFDKDWWNLYFLWGDEAFRNKAIAIWFQMAELAWKSKYYQHEYDSAGVEMREFERIGDRLPWKHKYDFEKGKWEK